MVELFEGTIKKFFLEKGYGFIIPDEDPNDNVTSTNATRDVYFHESNLKQPEEHQEQQPQEEGKSLNFRFRPPAQYERVQFEKEYDASRNRWYAMNIVRLTNLSYPPFSAKFGCPGCSNYFRPKLKNVGDHMKFCCPELLPRELGPIYQRGRFVAKFACPSCGHYFTKLKSVKAHIQQCCPALMPPPLSPICKLGGPFCKVQGFHESELDIEAWKQSSKDRKAAVRSTPEYQQTQRLKLAEMERKKKQKQQIKEQYKSMPQWTQYDDYLRSTTTPMNHHHHNHSFHSSFNTSCSANSSSSLSSPPSKLFGDIFSSEEELDDLTPVLPTTNDNNTKSNNSSSKSIMESLSNLTNTVTSSLSSSSSSSKTKRRRSSLKLHRQSSVSSLPPTLEEEVIVNDILQKHLEQGFSSGIGENPYGVQEAMGTRHDWIQWGAQLVATPELLQRTKCVGDEYQKDLDCHAKELEKWRELEDGYAGSYEYIRALHCILQHTFVRCHLPSPPRLDLGKAMGLLLAASDRVDAEGDLNHSTRSNNSSKNVGDCSGSDDGSSSTKHDGIGGGGGMGIGGGNSTASSTSKHRMKCFRGYKFRVFGIVEACKSYNGPFFAHDLENHPSSLPPIQPVQQRAPVQTPKASHNYDLNSWTEDYSESQSEYDMYVQDFLTDGSSNDGSSELLSLLFY